MFAIYKPLIFFFYLSIIPLSIGVFLFMRFLIFYLFGNGSGHIQSIVFDSSLILGFILIALGILGELIKHNRKILEKNMKNNFEVTEINLDLLEIYNKYIQKYIRKIYY